ncbi:YcxB family protein [Paludicola sp. MB14-C6]|uniref:YcxB family protein n=1 Tax=Paludihabitans sp. MB14-C6 TaxID=3070656 RepID=UPI0027DB82DB|nr:YcxB family protein [Paludicola sp. MB14-C6]WMJ21794.1 YcxB family protein [Paludicola sp. MB14-C6]
MEDKYEKLEQELEQQEEVTLTEKEALKNPQKEFTGGIETEEYDVVPKFTASCEEDLKDKEGIKIEYSFNGEEVAEGLKIYQKQTIYKRNLIYTGILFVIFVLYVFSIAKDPSQTLSIFLATMCVVVVAYIWFLPANHIKKTAKAADETEMRFQMTIYDNCIKIGEDTATYILNYNKEITKIFETVKLFVICAGKERIFILPKRCLKDGENTKIKELFQLTMDDQYFKKF